MPFLGRAVQRCASNRILNIHVAASFKQTFRHGDMPTPGREVESGVLQEGPSIDVAARSNELFGGIHIAASAVEVKRRVPKIILGQILAAGH